MKCVQLYECMYICNFLSTFPSARRESRAGMLPAEAFNLLVFFDNFCKLSHFPRKAIEDILPPFVFDFFLE